MEKLLHYIWKYRLFDIRHLSTTDGQPLEIIDTGDCQGDSGPDFFNAKIRLNGQIWAGNVEIHTKSSDWFVHRHQKDSVYDTVILHVVGEADCTISRTDGRSIPQFILPVSERLKCNFDFLMASDINPPCADRLHELDSFFITDWITALAMERLEQKTERILDWLNQEQGDWEGVCYRLLCRNLGFHTNSDAFERLARNTPLIFMQKHADSLFQIEAILFGQAGFLDNPSLCSDSYYRQLREEYLFLKQKFGLVSQPVSCWKIARMRPVNFPHIRIAMLARYIEQGFSLFSRICETESIDDFRDLFKIRLSGYWDTHYLFGEISATKTKMLGKTAIDTLLINTVAPLLYAYSIRNGNDIYKERASRLLECLKPETNRIVSDFSAAGIVPRNAFDSQALIQLRTQYCNTKKCLYCRIGHRLLSHP